jgi:hypothetical protein
VSCDSRQETLAHIEEVRELLARATSELTRRAIAHDASKLVEPEKSMFDRYTPMLRSVAYGSDEYNAVLAEMREQALGEHYRHNAHHPEHWEHGIADMSLIDLLEMLCDWIAATHRHDDGDIRRSIEQNQERFGYADEIKLLLLNTLPALDV